MHQHFCDDADLEYLIIDSTVVRAHESETYPQITLPMRLIMALHATQHVDKDTRNGLRHY